MYSLSSRDKTRRRYFDTRGCFNFSEIAALGWSFPLLRVPREERSNGREKTVWRYVSSLMYLLRLCLDQKFVEGLTEGKENEVTPLKTFNANTA